MTLWTGYSSFRFVSSPRMQPIVILAFPFGLVPEWTPQLFKFVCFVQRPASFNQTVAFVHFKQGFVYFAFYVPGRCLFQQF